MRLELYYDYGRFLSKQQHKYDVHWPSSMKTMIIALMLVSICTIPMVSATNQSNDTIITVDSTNLRFSPSTVTINEGDAVRFFWNGQILPHNAVEENETFDSGDTKASEDYRFVFILGLNGTFEYYCEPHRNLGMVGQIIVNPAPYVENNTTEDPVNEEMDDEDESFMPFLSMPILTMILAVAAIVRKDEI